MSTLSTLESHGESEFHDAPDSPRVDVLGRSPLRLAASRFRKDRLSMVFAGVVLVYLVVAISAVPLVLAGVLDFESLNPELVDGANGGLPLGSFGGISWDHPLGVEPGLGRDVLSRMVVGISLSLSVALSAALITVTIGTALGIVAGFAGGVVDGIVGRLIDLVLAFPSTLMLLALSGIAVAFMTDTLHIPRGPDGAFVNGLYVVVVLAAFGWPPIARLIRGQVLSLREREFVDAARLMGASQTRICFREILPNLWAPLLVYFTLLMPAFVSAEAALSFLGVGIKPPMPTLGNILTDSINWTADPVYFFAPAIAIAVIVVAFNLLGDGIRDALDPRTTPSKER